MTASKKYVQIKDPNNLVLTDLPFRAGQLVEVVVIAQDDGESDSRIRELRSLLEETQSLPQAQAISEEDIAAEIDAYRAER